MKGKKGIWLLMLISLCLLFGNTFLVRAQETHSLQLFFENVCASCNESQKFYDLFNRCISAEEKKTISYEIRTYNVFVEADRRVYEELRKESAKDTSDMALPVLVVDGQWISGYEKIEKELHGVLLEGKEAEISAEEPKADVNNTDKKSSEESDASDFVIPEIQAGDNEKAVLLFTTYSCDACQEVKEYLKKLGEKEKFAMEECSIADGDNIGLFKELLKIYNIDEKKGEVPAVFVGNTVLTGAEDIKQKLPALLDEEESSYRVLKERLAQIHGSEKIQSSSTGALFAAGLLAGFNPCAVSMLLMLFSILLTGKASVLKNGALYLVGKYLTYFGLGAGICFAASKVEQDFLTKFGKGMNAVIIVLFLTVAVLNFIDFLNVRKDEYGKIRMQLPKGLRRFNHKLLKKAEHIEGVFLGILVLGLGIAISVGEFFCTGQIYMASILYLIRENGGQLWQLMSTLLVYVTAMSIPAVVIMAVIHRTKGTGVISDFMLKHMGAIKLLNSVLFLIYAVCFILG